MIGKIKLRLPDGDIYFDMDNTISDIFKSLNESDLLYADVSLVIDDDKEKISEKVTKIDDNSASLYYDLPKNIAFTNKFQDRIKKEVPSIIESVYPDYYEITKINYIDETEDSIKLNIEILAKSEDAVNSLQYLDNNIGYIVDDILNYYSK